MCKKEVTVADRFDDREPSWRRYETGADRYDYGRERFGQWGIYGRRSDYEREGYWAEPTWRGYAYEREALGRAPWNIPGPYTGVGPQGYQRSDERIHEDVCERLTHHGQIDASNIQVNVDSGEVTLEGTVDSRQAKRAAEDMADSVMGVRNVHNRLRVSQGQEDQQGLRENLEDLGERIRESLT
ncbi:MAG TPA: hypothetical protein DEP84_36805 [Chloroflexi bacterium]|nr:hypothetical protein [Chloroflexota bacterium]